MSILTLVQLSYFIAATLFLLGLQRMASPKTARSGIQWAGVGMVLATVATCAGTASCRAETSQAIRPSAKNRFVVAPDAWTAQSQTTVQATAGFHKNRLMRSRMERETGIEPATFSLGS